MKSNQEQSVARKTPTDRPAPAKAEAIRERAYQLFCGRSETGQSSDPVMDWLQAEHAVRNHREIEGNNQEAPPQEKSPTK